MNITPFSAGSASAVDFQQPLALTVELARVAEDHKAVARPDDAIGDLGASPADIADAVNPANDGSPAQDIANKVIENIQPNSSSAQKLSDALGNPATDDAPKLQDAIEQPAEMLKPGREASSLKTPHQHTQTPPFHPFAAAWAFSLLLFASVHVHRHTPLLPSHLHLGRWVNHLQQLP